MTGCDVDVDKGQRHHISDPGLITSAQTSARQQQQQQQLSW